MADDRGVKHFDRRFVASNLKNLLHCPKCSKDYTYSQGEQNHRPFLLPCGHSLCENCLWKDRQQVRCVVCQKPAPPLIKAKNPASKFGVRVCDFYELNYHVLGEASSLIYFRSLDTEPVNESLSLANEVIIQATKCSECSQADAKGECSQCNAFYCHNCFDAVHKHSRVLQSHTFQKMSGGQPRGFRVGSQVFKMPSQKDCYRHRLPLTIFCVDCKRIHCVNCSDLYHISHKTKPLSEMNRRMVPEIHSTVQSLNSALMYIHNGQEVVLAAKKKLGDYASETLASVSKHFCHLHGLLQVAELQVVEKLRESSLPPQMELNEALGALSGYEALIKNLIQYLDKPNQFWMKDIIKLANEHLEKIPSTVEVSQITKNPYRISSEHFNIPSIIEHTFNCKFVNPNIKVSFKTDVERDRSLSSINKPDITFSQSSSSGKENTCLSNSKGPREQHQLQPLSQKSNIKSMSKSQKRRDQESSKSSLNSTAATINSFQPRDHHQLDFMRSFSALDITKPPNNETRGAERGDWFKTEALVNVRSINSPGDFYVQGVHAVKRVREELDTITHSLTDGRFPHPEIVVGQHYIIFHQDKKRYFRAMVSQKMATQDTYKVFLPDIGLYVDDVQSSHFRGMPKSLAHLPYSAKHCSLRELMPTGGANSEWDSKATTHLKLIVKNNPVYLIVNKPLSHDLHEVDLITDNNKTSISVRESFLYSGLARSRCGRPPLVGLKSLQKNAPTNLRLARPKLQIGDIFMIQMMHVEDPQEFYVMRHALESDRCLKQGNLQRYMDNQSIIMQENIFLGSLHLGCVLHADGQWKRASIEQILPDGYVLVRLVDDGPCQKVCWNQLFVLPSAFWEPELTIRCSLADVETLQDLSYVWTPEATAFFKQLTSNPKLHLEVVNFTEDVVFVALSCMRGGSETTNVAVQMVAQGHCTSIGENSRMFSTAKTSQRSSGLDVDTRRFLKQQKMQAVALTPFREPEAGTKDRNERVKVKVLYVRQPDEFYVTLPNFQSTIEELQKTVQKDAEAMYVDHLPRTDWKVGEMCYVRVQAQSDLETLWHRGLVTNVSSSPRYHVQLWDFGQVLEDVSNKYMTKIGRLDMTIAKSAWRCHLHGIQAVGPKWSSNAIDYFKDQVQAYDQIYVEGEGRDLKNNSLRVILWGMHTEVSGPFSPPRTKFVNINKALLRANMAAKNIDDNQQPVLDSVSVSSVGTHNSSDRKEMQTWFDKIDKLKNVCSPIDAPKVSPGFEHNDDMPPMELLNDLAKDQLTTGQTVPPAGWTTPRKCDKTIFTAIATNVNSECSVYLSLGSDKPYLEHIRTLLERHYKPLMKEQQDEKRSYTYAVGQPVLATYHMDNLLYRGIVKGLQNKYHEYTVYYVDYGNTEKVKADELLPYAPFPQLNAMCWLVNIDGVRPKSGRYSVKLMDTVHQQLVMKLSSVRVVNPKPVGSTLPTCSFKVGNVDIATMMIDCGMAIPAETTLKTSTPPLGLDAFKVFDQLENLAAAVQRRPGVQPHRRNESDSSVHQPLAKKFLVSNHFEDDKDFDCQQAAQEMYLNNSNVCADSDSDGCSGESQAVGFNTEDDEDEEEMGPDYYGHEMDIDIDGEESSDTPSDEMETESLSVSAANQLQRRIDLRHQDMQENVCFSPMDTSTERSHFDGSNNFKTLSLPTGVNEFPCRVENVLSAVELQIAPCLSEFTKYELNLVQETSLLTKAAAALKNPKLNDLCLARYSKDKHWYRAIVQEIQESTQQATVFYIDFHDSEQVSYTHLKEMPKELFKCPLRFSLRVKLDGVKKNCKFGDKTVLQSLRACLSAYSLVYARLHYPSNKRALSETGELDLIKVELFEDRNKKKLVYQSVIDDWMLKPDKKN